jgi:hypothetical protein
VNDDFDDKDLHYFKRLITFPLPQSRNVEKKMEYALNPPPLWMGPTGRVCVIDRPGNVSRSRSARYLQKHHRTPSLTDQQVKQLAIPEDSPEDSDNDDLESKRGPLVQNKSGELVKPVLLTSISRRRPLYTLRTPPRSPTAVHFNGDIEQVRHYLPIDKLLLSVQGLLPQSWMKASLIPYFNCEMQIALISR